MTIKLKSEQVKRTGCNLRYFNRLGYYFFLLIIIIGCTKQETVENRLASDAYKEGRYLTAITYCNETLNVNPDDYSILMIRAKSNLKLKNYSEAIRDFSSCIKIDGNFESYYYRSRTFLETNNLEESSNDLIKALSYDPENVPALFDYAYVETLLEDFEAALNTYEKVVSIDSLNSNAYVNIGNLQGRIGNSEAAIKSFSKAIKINPNDVLAHFNRATEKLIINDKHSAIEDLSFCVSIDSTNINTYFLLAETMIEIKDYKNAVEKINTIIQFDPQNARAYYLKGTCELALNEQEKACLSLRKAGELGYYAAYELITKNCMKKEKKKSKKK